MLISESATDLRNIFMTATTRISNPIGPMSLVVAKVKTPSDVFTDPEVKRKLVKRRRRSRKADLGLQSFFNIRSRCNMRESAAVINLLWQRTSADGKGSYQVWTSFLA